MSRWSWLAGALAGPLFVVSFLLQAPSRKGYNALRHPVSSLALGERGGIQVATFIVTGGLLTLFAGGLWQARRQPGHARVGALAVGAVGLGLLGAGGFPTDPISGYPPGTADVPAPPTPHGQLHYLFSSLVFFGLPTACVGYGRQFARTGERTPAITAVVSGAGMIAAFVTSSFGFAQAPKLVAFGGLFQRIALIIGFAWLTLLAIRQRPA